jgi:hypothetical protein
MASVRKVPRVRSSVNVAPHRAHFETLLAELLGLSPRTNSAMLSVAASEGLREIAWESDLRFA